MKFFSYLFFTIAAYILISCEEEISWKVKEMPEMLVVEGSFTNESGKQHVTLSKSATYFYNMPEQRVSGAMISVTDGTTVYTLTENPSGSGIYETIDAVAGEAGKTYTLEINLKEPINNCVHYAASGTMVKGIDIDSTIAYIYENPLYGTDEDMDSLMIILVTIGQDPPEIHNYYQFDLYKNDIWLNDTIDEASIMDDTEGLNGQVVNSFFFFYAFEPNDTVGLKLESVEKSYFDFVTGVQNLANQSLDPFSMSGPPANAISNISGAQAIGFFKVAYISRGTAIAQYYEEPD